jgi:hypothetical protein
LCKKKIVFYILTVPRKCLNYPDTFCYVCDELVFKSHGRNDNPLINKFYELYFGSQVNDQDKSLAPSYLLCDVCKASRRMANRFPLNADRHSHRLEGIRTSIIRFLRFFVTNVSGITSKSKQTVKYPDFKSAIKRVPQSEKLPVTKHPENRTFSYKVPIIPPTHKI